MAAMWQGAGMDVDLRRSAGILSGSRIRCVSISWPQLLSSRNVNPGRSSRGIYGGTMAGEEHEQFEDGVDAAGLLRAQLQEIHRELDDGLTAFLRGLAPAAPPSSALPLRLYVHAATVEDVTIQSLLRQVAPVYETDWAGKGPAGYSTTDLAP